MGDKGACSVAGNEHAYERVNKGFTALSSPKGKMRRIAFNYFFKARKRTGVKDREGAEGDVLHRELFMIAEIFYITKLPTGMLGWGVVFIYMTHNKLVYIIIAIVVVGAIISFKLGCGSSRGIMR